MNHLKSFCFISLLLYCNAAFSKADKASNNYTSESITVADKLDVGSDLTICQGEKIEITPTTSGLGVLTYTSNKPTPLEAWNGGSLEAQPLENTTYTFKYEYVEGGVPKTETKEVEVTVTDFSSVTPLSPINLSFGQTETISNQNAYYKGVIRIKKGGLLIIDNSEIKFINDWEIYKDNNYQKTESFSGIIVEEGGELRIQNGSKLTSAGCHVWDGIQIWGDDISRFLLDAGNIFQQIPNIIDLNPDPFSTVPKLFPPINNLFSYYYRHGICYFEDGSVIENADQAFSLYNRYPTSQNSGHLEKGKGLLYIDMDRLIQDRPSIVSCNKGIVGQGNSKIVNNSGISSLTFLGSNSSSDLEGYDAENAVAVELNRVRDIYFNNIYIALEGNNTVGFLLRDAVPNFNLTVDFEVAAEIWQTHTGIEAYSTGSYDDRFQLQIGSMLLRNYAQGMVLKNLPFPLVIGAEFREQAVGTTSLQRPEFGIYAEGIKGGIFTENEFTLGALSIPEENDYGIIIKDSDPTEISEVYLNTFEKKMGVGIQTEGTNTNLRIDCNQFQKENDYDIAVANGVLMNQGSCQQGGTPSANQFAGCSGFESNLFASSSSNPFEYNSYNDVIPNSNCVSPTINLNNCLTNRNTETCQPKPDLINFTPQWPTDSIINPTTITQQILRNNYLQSAMRFWPVDSIAKFIGYDNTSSIRNYVATMLNEKDLEEAQSKLNLMASMDELTNDDNLFIDLFSLLIRLANDGIAWHNMPQDDLDIVENIAYSSGLAALPAQSVYGVATGTRFPINIAPLVHGSPQPLIQKGADNETISKIEVSPNPARENVTLNSKGGNKITSIIVQTVKGQEIAIPTEGKGSSTVKLDISTLPEGFYLLHITIENEEPTVEQLVVH